MSLPQFDVAVHGDPRLIVRGRYSIPVDFRIGHIFDQHARYRAICDQIVILELETRRVSEEFARISWLTLRVTKCLQANETIAGIFSTFHTSLTFDTERT